MPNSNQETGLGPRGTDWPRPTAQFFSSEWQINGSILFQLFQILNSTTSSSLYEPGTPTGSGAKVAGGRRRLRGDGRPVAGHAGAGRRADDPGPLPPAAPLRGGRPPQLRQLHAENTGN